MKNATIILLCFLLLARMIRADSIVEKPLLNIAWELGGGSIRLHDDYLSPLEQIGWQVQLQTRFAGYFKRHVGCISWFNRYIASGGQVINLPATAGTLYGAFNVAYGVQRHFHPANNLMLGVGGTTLLDVMCKYNTRNVNNPVSADASMGLMAAASIRYNWHMKRLFMGFEYNLESPIMGLMFVPEMGMSYYELSFGSWRNVLHFSSLHNKCGLSGQLNIDFVLKRCVLRVYMTHNHLYWRANNLQFNRREVIAGIGIVTDLLFFAGKSTTQRPTAVWQ